MKKYFYTLLLLCCFDRYLYAQVFKNDLADMYQQYMKEGDFEMGIQIDVYINDQAVPVISKKASVIKTGEKYLSTFDGTEILLSVSALTLVNHHDKAIVYRGLSKYEWDSFQKNAVSMNLDSVTQQCDSVRYIGRNKGLDQYRIFSSKSQISQTDLYLNTDSKALQKLVYHYNIKYTQQPYSTEIFFTKKNANAASIARINNLDKAVTLNGKKVILNPDYKQYNLTIVNDEE